MVELASNSVRGNEMYTNGGKDLGYKFGYRHQFGSIMGILRIAEHGDASRT
jgi:hypothetical protein